MRSVSESETIALETRVPSTSTTVDQDEEKLIQTNLDKYRQEIAEIQSVYTACISEMRLEMSTKSSEEPALKQKLTTLKKNATDNREIIESKERELLSNDPSVRELKEQQKKIDCELENCQRKWECLKLEILNANMEMKQFQKQMLLQIETIVDKHVPGLLDHIQRVLTEKKT